MIKMIDANGTPVRVGCDVTPEDVAEILAAGWMPAGASWRKGLMDRFTKRDSNGAILALHDMIDGRGRMVWRVGVKGLVDNCYGEYCDHYTDLKEALAAR